MSGFFNKLKEVFGSKEEPKFKTYQPPELKLIAMKTRLVLQQRMEELFQKITAEDQQFRYAGQDPWKIYNILQSIGQKVVEAESIKILMEMMRKVQNFSPQIIQTNGDIALLKKQILWFQCVLWYRRENSISNLEDLYNFCFNFFKGVDVTAELHVKCEVFQLFPILKYLPTKGKFPLQEIIPYIQPYVSCNIDQPTFNKVIEISKGDIKNVEENKPKVESYINPAPFPKPGPQEYPRSNVYSPYPPSEPKKPPQNVNPYQSNPYQSKNQGNIGDHNPFPPFNPSYNVSQMNNPHNNSPYSQFNPNQPNKPSNQMNNNNFYPTSPYNQSNISNNNFNNSKNNIPTHNPQNPYSSNSNPYNAMRQDPPYLNRPMPSPKKNQDQINQAKNQPNIGNSNVSPSKTNFMNTLMRGNYAREPVERDYHEQYGSRQPPNRPTPQEQLIDLDFQKTMRDLEQIQKSQSQKTQQQIARKQEQGRRKQQAQRRQRERKQQEERQKEERRIELARKQKQQQEKRKQEERQRNRREEEQKKRKQEEQKRERELEERQRQLQQRRRERQNNQRDSQFQLNVFSDNEREVIDRGTSGRFSANFGMKVDFGDERQEQFSHESINQIQNSMLKIKMSNQKDNQFQQPKNYPPLSTQNFTKDEMESLEIIFQNKGCSPTTEYKMFYFKKINTSQ